MSQNDKLKNGNSLETQFWSDDVEVDHNSPLIKSINKLWDSEEDYHPSKQEMKKLEQDMQEYHKKKNNTQE